MATGLASGVADSILNALCRNVAWTQPAGFFVKLHLADPGASGATSPAANTTRMAATMSASSGGIITNSAAVTWTSVPNAETYSHVSFWSASTSGTFLGSDALNTPRLVAIGDTFEIPIGDLDLDLTPIAA